MSKKWAIDSCGDAAIVSHKDGRKAGLARIIDNYFDEQQCEFVMSVPGIEGHVCCLLGRGHAGSHGIDDAVVSHMITRCNNELERLELQRLRQDVKQWKWLAEYHSGEVKYWRKEAQSARVEIQRLHKALEDNP